MKNIITLIFLIKYVIINKGKLTFEQKLNILQYSLNMFIDEYSAYYIDIDNNNNRYISQV